MDLPLNYDIVEIAFLLKLIGFQITSMDFDEVKNLAIKDIEIDLKCMASGIKSKFVLKSAKCTCPSKPAENNNSLWEVQGRAPTTPEKAKSLVHDTSCTVLPDITKQTASLGRATLIMLLQHYHNDLIRQQKAASTPDAKDSAGVLPRTNNSIEVYSLHEIKVEPNLSTFSTSLQSTSPSIFSSPEIEITNIIPHIIVHDPNHNEEIVIKSDVQELVPQQVSPLTSNGISSPNIIRQSPSFTLVNHDNERDIYVIESITKARKELESALLLLKCNITRDLSDSSILVTTPQSIKQMASKGLRTENARNSINYLNKRRASLGSSSQEGMTVNDVQVLSHFSKPLPKAPVGLSNAKLKPVIKAKTLHPDTPRPAVDLKQCVEKGIAKSKMLRGGSSTNLKGAVPLKTTVKPKPATVAKKP